MTGVVKILIILFVIGMILSIIYRRIRNELSNLIERYITESIEKDAEISQKNDLLMKEKQEKAKNTHFVKCPHCGGDNILTESIGTCKYCRRQIEYKN